MLFLYFWEQETFTRSGNIVLKPLCDGGVTMQKLRRQFLQPADEYTPIPFWFWNDRLTEDEIIRQIHDFKAKGVMGFIIHPRIGIPKEIEYLSDRFMELVTCAVEEAKRLGMKVILYDEAMYPSGSAHGQVVATNPRFASRGLLMKEYPVSDRKIELVPEFDDPDDLLVSVQAVKKISENSIDASSTMKLACEQGKVVFAAPDQEQWSVLMFIETYSRGTIRGIHFGEDDGQPDAPAAADLLNPQAMKTYINLTHDRYYEVLKDYFGNTIIAMFTDEPAILGRRSRRGLRPWTTNFLQDYISFGCDELDLPVLWFDAGEVTAVKRKQYKQAINKRLLRSYYIPISKWCEEHGIALTGHPEASDEIGLLNYFQIPGQDVVWRWVAPEDEKGITGVHSTQGKCSADAARHSGKRRNSNECFGCCGPNGVHWAFTVADMKWYMDWLFVRGVNLLYPHAFFYSIEGKGRFDERPPDVGPNNIWWPHYRIISDYIKRMSWLMTDSVNQAQVAVLCEEDHLPWQIVRPLFEHQIEFNYLENKLLESSVEVDGGTLKICQQSYRVLVIEDLNHLTSKAQTKVEQFIAEGGTVIVYNPAQLRINLPVSEITIFSELVEKIRQVLEPDLFVSEIATDLRLSHVIKDGVHFFLLVNEGMQAIKRKIRLNVIGKTEAWDAWNGTITELPVFAVDQQRMELELDLPVRGNLIIMVDPNQPYQLFKQNQQVQLIQKVIDLSSNWRSTNPLLDSQLHKGLICWTTIPELADFSGKIIYENNFVINDFAEIVKVEIDFGEVHEIAELTVNQQAAGVRLFAPYSFEITNLVKPGINQIQLQVTNTLANRLVQAKIKSGLLGKVQLKISYKP